jgi:hypothetical protein
LVKFANGFCCQFLLGLCALCEGTAVQEVSDEGDVALELFDVIGATKGKLISRSVRNLVSV